MEVGTVQQVDIDSEMRAAYLEYAMSTIVSRALPDARDGLKPVHRRILYAMYDMGLRPDSPYRKSARIVGEVLGKYHPHGDAAVYDAMVRLAQDFAMRYPLVDGQGNFGSIDGDAAAAMRYTEARMENIGIDLLADIGKNTVDFVENFDGSLQEPSVLPASLPNLIVNGSSGIAVGMSTSVPPHNIREVCEALVYMLDNWEKLDTVGLPDLLQFVKGPDFPTGGLVFRYTEGPETRLRAQIEPNGRKGNVIVLPEIPNHIDPESLAQQIQSLTREARIGGLLGIYHEKRGAQSRLLVGVKPDIDPEVMLNQLYDLVPMMKTHLVDNLAQAYATGRGKLVVQAKVHVEALDRNRNRLIITELPYQVNKTSLIERIAELVRDERIEGLTDLRDESDRQGMRIVIDLTRTVDPYAILNQLYKLTPMRQTFSVIMLALVDDEPRLLSLKQALRVYIEHRFVVVRRRSEYELERALERAHILEGYLTALDHLDEVIDTIRRSRTAETAHENLRKKFSLSEVQADAILNMPLRRLAALERKKIDEEYKEKKQQIKHLQGLLQDPKLLREVIKDELSEIQNVYSDPRRTVIVEAAAGDASAITELVPDTESWLTITGNGMISRTLDEQQPKITQEVKDPPRIMLKVKESDILYLFASDGMAATVAVHQIPQVQDAEQGSYFANIAPLTNEQEVVAALARPSVPAEGYLFLTSRGGMVKRISVEDMPGLSAKPFRVMGLTDDTLGWASWTRGTEEIVLVTAEGKGIRFLEEEVRPMGLPAGGVNGVKLGDAGDEVIAMMVARPETNVWVITDTGMAKSSSLDEFPLQGRYGQGVIAAKITDKTAQLVAAVLGAVDETVIIVTNKRKPKQMRIGAAPQAARNTPGVSVIALGPNEKVVRAVVPDDRSINALTAMSAAAA
jgi:DNA gyrase subunit A